VDVWDPRYVEGDAWHYRFFVPHDAAGLVQMFGVNNFVSALDEFFSNSKFDPFNIFPNPYYWAGNEEDLLSVYLFNYAGRPDLTQQYVRWLMENKYTTQPDGLPGNDDYGTMSAWFIWGALGFYPITGSTQFLVGSPIFDQVVISRPQGALTIIAHNASPKNIYVDSIVINGKPVNMNLPILDYSDMKGPTTIQFWMKS